MFKGIYRDSIRALESWGLQRDLVGLCKGSSMTGVVTRWGFRVGVNHYQYIYIYIYIYIILDPILLIQDLQLLVNYKYIITDPCSTYLGLRSLH